MNEEEFEEFLYKLFDEIYKKYGCGNTGLYRSKL
jgi:hypothetical protein